MIFSLTRNLLAPPLTTPISVSSALITPTCPFRTTLSLSAINTLNPPILLTVLLLFRWIGINGRLTVAGFGNVLIPMSPTVLTSRGFFPIYTPSGLVF